MKYLRFIPLFLFLLLTYDAMALTKVDMASPLYSLHLPSGAVWAPTWGDVLLMLGVVAMFIELVKSTSSNVATVIEHSLSFLVLFIFFAEFLIMPGAGTSTFLILMLMSLLDVLAGFIITVSTARRDVLVGQ